MLDGLFISFVLVIIFLTDSYESQIQPTRTVSIQAENLKFGKINIYFVCPNIRSKNDMLKYYKMKNGTKILIEKMEAFGNVLNINQESDLGDYECSVVSEDNSSRNATLNIADIKKLESPTKFIYDVSQTKYVIQKSGSVELDCEAPADQFVTWYKPAQYHIYTGKKLNIKELNNFDFGTYYCAIGITTKAVLEVKKIILLPEMPKQKEKTIDEDVQYFDNLIPEKKEIRFRPSKSSFEADTLTWEQPPGTILLEHGRDYYRQSYSPTESQLPFYYRISRNGDYLINSVGKVFISQFINKEVEMSVEGSLAYGASMKINCVPSPSLGDNIEIVWKKDGVIIERGNTLLITNFENTKYGNYSCEIKKEGRMIKSRELNLSPQKDLSSKIEMLPDPGLYYSYHAGKNKELHCEISFKDGNWQAKSNEVVWTFQGRKIEVGNPLSAFGNTKRFGRLDAISTSILVLKKMGLDNEGIYKCFQGSKAFAANLLMERSDILLELAPEVLTLEHDKNIAAEFHCRIDTVGLNSSFIKWTFIPELSTKEEPLPTDFTIENNPDLEETSLIKTSNTLKKHEGLYVCRVFNKEVRGKLIVKMRIVLTVNPKEITVKPGNTARFICNLNGVKGKLIWKRLDKKEFSVDKESTIGQDENILLEVKKATTADDGTIYQCMYNALIESVTLWVKDDCPLNERKCKNETCIDETKFCDGKDDCGDNSDEDPKRCSECTPNSIHCDFLNNSIPLKRCVIRHWKCDGTDDCGNNFDELFCPVKNKDKCLGTHFLCGNETLIPRAYWCDGEPDCPSMEDEDGCSPPQVIEPSKLNQFSVVENTTLRLRCQVSGRSVPTITWRFNWGYLPEKLDYNISDVVTNCSLITSTLTINNIAPEQSGVYTCEAIAKRRVMAPDFVVTITKGSICTRPYFNNDAWYKEFCIKCYCSNVTDDCTSASGYITNPDFVESQVKASDAAIINHKTNVYFEPARSVSFANETTKLYYINTENYEKLVPDNDHFLGGSFNMRGSWINRYGYPLTYNVILSGDSVGHISGPIVTIMGFNEKKVYFCPMKSRIPVYASNESYTNKMQVILWEQDRWFSDSSCTASVSRPYFLELLRDVRLILFRIKYFNKQTDFKMSKITVQEAIESKSEHTWISRIEKCKCPDGYSGLSCEIKAK